jgi:predicted permease
MREFAVRAALGAGKGRLLRQLLTESVVLATAGGSLGLLLAAWGTKAALKALPGTLPRVEEIGLDARVLLFTAGVTLLAGILFGLAPARKTLLHDVYETLKEGGRGASGMRHRAQSVFVVLEMAMALVLLVGAGLMIRSLAALWSADPGFRAENAMTFGVWVPSTTANMSADAVRAQIRELDRKFGAVPGVQAISQVWGAIPIINDDESLFWMDGQSKPSSEADMNMAIEYIVEPQYLNAMGTPLRRGRFFTEQDNEHSPTVVVVDEIFARKFFGDVNPIGKRINLEATGSSAEIIGIVAHVNQWGLDSDDTNPLRAELYIPCMQMPDAFVSGGPGALNLVVRYDKNAPPILDGIRRSSREMNSKQVIFGAQTLTEIISDSLATQRFAMILLGAFAGIAVILASVGIYGVISYLVGQRTQEIGVRVALGAMRRDVLVLVLGEGLKLTLTGVGVGLLAALGLAQLMKSVLYGVSASDPLTFVGVGIVLTGVAVLACYMPARRAMKVDPLVALRYE